MSVEGKEDCILDLQIVDGMIEVNSTPGGIEASTLHAFI